MSDTIPRTAFVHIPKCGGQSFEAVLRGAYYETGYSQFFPDEIDVEPDPNTYKESDFATLTADELTHHHHGVWGHISFPQYAAIFTKPHYLAWNFVTVLRNPVEFYISLYQYVRGYEEHPQHEDAKRQTLREFLDEQGPNNFQCAFATGQLTFEGARHVLAQRYTAYCALDDISEFASVYSDFLDGALRRDISQLNASNSHQLFTTLNADDLRWLIAQVREDYLLVEWVRRTWRRHMMSALRARNHEIDVDRHPEFLGLANDPQRSSPIIAARRA